MINFNFKIVFILSFITLVFLVQTARAGDCMQDPVYEKDWNAEVTTGARLRDIPCMEGSVVLTTIPVGEIIHVIAVTDGWYKIETSKGTVGWVGQWLITPTVEPFNSESGPKEALYDISGHIYESAIRYLANKLIVQGYSDQTFKPEKTVNRVEFVKIIVSAVYDYNPDFDVSGYDIFDSFGLPFSDIEDHSWYLPYLRIAYQNGLINGYPDGTFKPNGTINIAEASKILVNAFKLNKQPSGSSAPWYEQYIKPLQSRGYIPPTVKSAGQFLNRGEMAEFMWRLMEKIHNRPFSQLIK